MKEIILVKCGEIALKGLNKSSFEDMLAKNIRRRIRDFGEFKITKAQSTLYVTPVSEDCDIDGACEKIGRVFGVSAYSRAAVAEKSYEALSAVACDYLTDALGEAKTFKVEAKRADKQFPMTSPEICRELGGDLLERFPHLKVDVIHPDVVVIAEIRDFAAYVHAGKTAGAGGMPVGSAGKAALLLSGGIDSPVAGFMMAKRGLELSAIHFVSPPYTSERAKLKVLELAKIMTDYCGRMGVHVVGFTKIQEEIRDRCPEELFTVIMRRVMLMIAEKLCERHGFGALVTGESLGQVASQTLPAIACTDAACDTPVLRPLIGMDKEEIVRIARKIDTFETSILPYEDCCTVFTPKHPRTRPKLLEVMEAEKKLDLDALIEDALENTEVVWVG